MSDIKTTPCKGCGRSIVWKVTETGARIPLDARPQTVYRIAHHDEGLAVGAGKAFISHFLTCPKASEFSGGKR